MTVLALIAFFAGGALADEGNPPWFNGELAEGISVSVQKIAFIKYEEFPKKKFFEIEYLTEGDYEGDKLRLPRLTEDLCHQHFDTHHAYILEKTGVSVDVFETLYVFENTDVGATGFLSFKTENLWRVSLEYPSCESFAPFQRPFVKGDDG